MASLNPLQRYIAESGMSETEAMNALQTESPRRLISDCCSDARDVADSDCAQAVEWLKVRAARLVALRC